jgi:hypothetical protein
MVSQMRHSAQSHDPARNQGIPLYVGNRRVALISGGVLRKTINTNHLLRKPPAIAFDEAVIRQTEAAGATLIAVFNADNGVEYSTSLRAFLAHAFVVDRGFGRQLALTMNRWHTGHQDGQQLTIFGTGDTQG